MEKAGPICGAVLIGPKTIISLAVCFPTKQPNRYSFKIGSVDLTKTNTWYTIEEIFYHKCFGMPCHYGKRHFYYNLAIAILEKQVK